MQNMYGLNKNFNGLFRLSLLAASGVVETTRNLCALQVYTSLWK